MGHDLILIGGFILCEFVFMRIEHWFKHYEAKLRAVRHGTLVVWAFHPSVQAGILHWADHAWTAVVLASSQR